MPRRGHREHPLRLEHLSPSYLKQAIEEVDAYFVELGKLTSAIKGPSSVARAPVRDPTDQLDRSEQRSPALQC